MHEITRPLARSLQVGKPCFGVLRPVLGGAKQAFHKGVVVADAGARVLAHLFSLQSPHDALDVTAACRALMERIHQDCRYESASTDIHTPVLQALEQRKGVCQDFAHIRKLPSRWRRKTSSGLCWAEEVVAWSQFFGPRLFRSISSHGTKNPAQR